MPLPESQRRETLQVLGIDCYLPRVQLPGAPVSALYPQAAAQAPAEHSLPPEEQAPVQEKAAPTPARTPRPEPPPKTVTRAAQPATPVEKPVEQAPTPETAPARKPREEVKLQLLCIRAGGELAILAAMPHMGPAQLSSRHQALLANLLRGCGLAPGDLALEDKPFRWPMVTGLHVDNSKRAAATALKAYLHQKMTDWETSKLLVLGEAVVARLFESEEGTTDLALPDSWQTAWTRSLDELLQRPVLKKDAWRQIRQQFA